VGLCMAMVAMFLMASDGLRRGALDGGFLDG
jgi:hypothetical protein